MLCRELLLAYVWPYYWYPQESLKRRFTKILQSRRRPLLGLKSAYSFIWSSNLQGAMVWGQELWDAYDRVAARLTANTTTLTSTYAKLLRDKAEVSTYICIIYIIIYISTYYYLFTYLDIIIYISSRWRLSMPGGCGGWLPGTARGPAARTRRPPPRRRWWQGCWRRWAIYLQYLHTFFIPAPSVYRWAISPGSTRSWRTVSTPSSARWIHNTFRRISSHWHWGDFCWLLAKAAQ